MTGLARFGDRRPITLQLRDALRELIADGQLSPGDQLPSEAELATRFGVARGSVREALKHLEQDGIVDVRHGLGRFVSAIGGLIIKRPVTTFESVTEMLRARGFEVTTAVLSAQRAQATLTESSELSLPREGEIVRVRRLRLHVGTLLVYSENVFAASLLDAGKLHAGEFAGSLNRWLGLRGRGPVSSAAELQTATLPADVRALPEAGVEEPWLLITERCIDRTGTPVLLSRDYHRGSVFSFQVLRRS